MVALRAMYEGTLPRVRKIKQSAFLYSCNLERDGRKRNAYRILVGKPKRRR
jgi:hypothetical protein